MTLGAWLTLAGGAAVVAALVAWFRARRRRPIAPRIAPEPAYKRLEQLGEQYYDALYEGSGSRAGLLSEIKECFTAAIDSARHDGFAAEAQRLEARLDHIVAGYRRHFS